MNKNIFEGEWNKIKGKIQEHWAEITDDDLLKIKSDGLQLYGMIEKKYGYTKDEAKEKVDNFIDKLSSGTGENALAKEIVILKQTLSDIISSFVSQITGLTKKVPDQVHRGQEKIEHSIESHLWSSLGIAAVVGVLLSMSFMHKGK